MITYFIAVYTAGVMGYGPWKGEISMKLPKAVRCVGKTDGKQQIYIEDYALQYLKYCRKMAEKHPAATDWADRQFAAYGCYDETESREYYVIYLLLPAAGSDLIRAEETAPYQLLGNVRVKTDPGRKRAICAFREIHSGQEIAGGYSVFYDENNGMKEYLGQYFEQQLWENECIPAEQDDGTMSAEISGAARKGYRKISGTAWKDHGKRSEIQWEDHRTIPETAWKDHGKRSGIQWEDHRKIPETAWKDHGKRSGIQWEDHRKIPADRRAAGRNTEPYSVYFPVRVAVLGLLMIICVLAVTTVNDYERLHDFVKKAVYTGGIMEEVTGDRYGEDQKLSSVQGEREN